MMRTKIINATAQDLRIRGGGVGMFRVRIVPSMGDFFMDWDPSATYREYELSGVEKEFTIFLGSDDLAEAKEIRVYESTTGNLAFRLSKMRRSTNHQMSTSVNISPYVKDIAAFDAVKKEATSRMTIVENSHGSLVMLLKQVKICPAQCQNLVDTCLPSVLEMKEAYYQIPEDALWQLYSSKKLAQLISSCDELLSTLGSIEDLLQACGSNWCGMALVVSLPLPPFERMCSKFDILIKELHWNLETIHYALDLTRGMEFEWNKRKRRYVLGPISGANLTVAEDMEPEQSRGLALEDREHLLSQLDNGSILVPGNLLLRYLWQLGGIKFPSDRLRDNIVAIMQRRLKEPAVLSNDQSSVPDCFWINPADLKLRSKLSENFSRSVWEGEWCGQAVAIGVTKDTTRAAVDKEAGFLLKVQHPNVVGFLGCAFTHDAPPPVGRGVDKSCSAGYLVMELMQEDLWRMINRRAKSHLGSPFTFTVTVDILLQIVGAMVHLHSLDIMHRDLKSANCLVNPRTFPTSSSQVHTLKLIDFEFSKELNPNAALSNHTANTGTRRWMAPEVWGRRISDGDTWERPLVPYTVSADVWSFGMICYEVTTGLEPFYEFRSNTDLEQALRGGKRPSIPSSVNCLEGLKALMSRCWAQEPSDRPNFKDIEKSLWVIKYELEVS